MPSLRKKKPLAKPFVMTVARVTIAMLAPACGTTISNPPPPDDPCPPTMPASGAVCSVSTTCDYGTDECGLPLTASCVGGTWQVSGPAICNPPPPDPECPTDLPVRGAACNWNWQSGFGCSYVVDIGCGMQSISVMCNSTTVTVEYTAPTCGQCSTLTSESTCNTDAGCRWLTPGCDMPALPMAGCFAVADCTGDMECTTAGDTCQQLSYNPCYNQACNACGAPASVCLPPVAP
jgi:hypothetical protein